MDTSPLAVKADLVINEYKDFFTAGVQALSRLTEGTTFVVRERGVNIPVEETETLKVEEFSGFTLPEMWEPICTFWLRFPEASELVY